MLLYQKKGQSILEYALLLGVIIAGILIMQSFVKRGFQGNLKESADKMGEQFSASDTTIKQARNLTSNQTIVEEVGTRNNTTLGIGAFMTGTDLQGTVDRGVYSYSNRTGGNATSETLTNTSSAQREGFKMSDYANTTVTDYTLP